MGCPGHRLAMVTKRPESSRPATRPARVSPLWCVSRVPSTCCRCRGVPERQVHPLQHPSYPFTPSLVKLTLLRVCRRARATCWLSRMNGGAPISRSAETRPPPPPHIWRPLHLQIDNASIERRFAAVGTHSGSKSKGHQDRSARDSNLSLLSLLSLLSPLSPLSPGGQCARLCAVEQGAESLELCTPPPNDLWALLTSACLRPAPRTFAALRHAVRLRQRSARSELSSRLDKHLDCRRMSGGARSGRFGV